MQNWLRRVRGTIGMGVVWAAAWSRIWASTRRRTICYPSVPSLAGGLA